MRIGTKIGLGINALLIGTWGVITWDYVERHREEWARDQYLQRVCSEPGFIPADIRCIIVRHVKHTSPTLVAAVAYQESKFRKDVCSPVGACGVMQFMPKTARAYNVTREDALSSILGGDRLLRDLLVTYKGNLGLALAGYNCGTGCVQDWRRGKRTLPKETRDYIKAITGHTIEAWLSKRPPTSLGGHALAMEKHINI